MIESTWYIDQPIVFLVVVAVAIFVARRILLWALRKSGEATTGLISQRQIRWLQASLIAIVFAALWGPGPLIFLIACYLATIPAILQEDESVHLDQLIVAVAFGLLGAGLLYVVCAMVGLNGRIAVPVVLLCASIINIRVWGLRLLPVVSSGSSYVGWVLVAVFGGFSGLTLVASVMMGLGDYPMVFFHLDTPLRLTHAHEILGLTQYPQEALTTKGVFRAYHYGGPASAAVLADVTALPVHRSMFLVVIPVLLTGCFGAIWLLCRSLISGRGSRLLGTALFLPYVGLGAETYQRYIYTAQAHGIDVVKKVGQGFLPLNFTDSDLLENFGGGVWDVSIISGIFALLLAAILLIQRQTTLVALYGPLLFLTAVFSRVAVAPMVAVLLGARLLKSIREFRWQKILLYLAFSGALTILVLIYFGVITAAGDSTSIRSSEEILKKLNWLNESIWRRQYWQSAEVTAVAFAALIFFVIKKASLGDCRDSHRSLLVLGVMIGTLFSYAMVTTLRAEDLTQVFKATWIAIPLIVVAMLGITGRAMLGKTVVTFFLIPFLLIAVMAHWQKYQQAIFTLSSPVRAQESYSTTLLAEALRHIPVDSSIVVTNNFRYLWAKNHFTPITAIFGHQAYAIDTYWMVHDSELRDQAGFQIGQQKRLLSSLFNRAQPEFSKDVISFARKSGWTHFLLDKSKIGRSWRTPMISFGSSDIVNIGSHTDEYMKAIKTSTPFSIQRAAAKVDRVSCARAEFEPDGKPDNVYRLVIDNALKTDDMPRMTNIRLIRLNPPGLSQARAENYPLGVSNSIEGRLLNGEQGEVKLMLSELGYETWLFSCADGHDLPGSKYFANIEFEKQAKITQYDEADDVPLPKLFENSRYAVFSF